LTTPALPLAGGTVTGNLDVGGTVTLQSGIVNASAALVVTVPSATSTYFKHADATYFYSNADVLKFGLNNTDGEAYKTVAGSWTGISDSRLKQQVEEFLDGLDVIEQLNPISYEYNGRAGTDSGKRYVGLLADDVLAIVPEMVGSLPIQLNAGDEELTDILTLDPTRLTYLLLNSCKELAKLNRELEMRVAALENAR